LRIFIELEAARNFMSREPMFVGGVPTPYKPMPKSTKRKIGKANTIEGRMLRSAAKYLESKGYSVMVINAARVQSAGASSFELVLRFTGGPKQFEANEALVGKGIRAMKTVARKAGA
jgi:hypothetical protein